MPFKSEKQRKWMHANEPEMADKWEKEEVIVREKLRNLIKQEIKSINEGFEKYHLGGLLDSRLKKRLERAIKIWGGKIDAVGDDYIKFRLSSFEVKKFPALLKKLDRNKNVWIGDKRKNNIWDRRQKINKLEATTSVSVPGYLTPLAFKKSTQKAIDTDNEDDEKSESMAAPFRRRKSRGLGRPMKVSLDESGILYRAGVKKYGKEGMKKIQQAAGKRKSHAEIGKIKDKYEKDKKESVREGHTISFSKEEMAQLHNDGQIEKDGHTYVYEESVNELQMAPFSSKEARQHINQDIKKMSKELGKTSHDIIKMMMDGVKGGKYTAMDIARGVKEGPAGRTHFGEMTFIQSLWNKVRDKFRRYSKHGKLS